MRPPRPARCAALPRSAHAYPRLSQAIRPARPASHYRTGRARRCRAGPTTTARRSGTVRKGPRPAQSQRRRLRPAADSSSRPHARATTGSMAVPTRSARAIRHAPAASSRSSNARRTIRRIATRSRRNRGSSRVRQRIGARPRRVRSAPRRQGSRNARRPAARAGNNGSSLHNGRSVRGSRGLRRCVAVVPGSG